MADTLLDAKAAAEQSRVEGLDELPARIRNRYLGAPAHGRTANTGRPGTARRWAN